jgi:hypothetical protein
MFRPRGEDLEERLLLVTNLGGTSPPTLPIIAGTSPLTALGMDFGVSTLPAGSLTNTLNRGAGFSVSDLGDLNGDGYDDFAIGSPTAVIASSGATRPVLGNGAGSFVYVVFGSNFTAGAGTSTINDWLTTSSTPTNMAYQPTDRVGDTGQLGNATQTNPINSGMLRFPFSGVTFEALSNPTSMLGASVSNVKMPNGQRGILMGAPGANGGAGEAYLVWQNSSGTFNNFVGKGPINLDDPNFATDFPGLNEIKFVNSILTGGNLGFSVAGGFNILGDGSSDVILGAPLATVVTSTSTGGITPSTGVVYVVSTAILPSGVNTVDVTTLGQSGTQSVVLAGAAATDMAGFSVADAGDVNGATAGGANVDDLLIGAPTAASAAGAAYLVYGGSGLAGLSTITGNARFIILSNVGLPSGTTGAVPGAAITGPAGGSLTGYSVASAGDFNNDGFGDFLIGSPGFSSSSTTTAQGEATMFYGAASTSAALPSGQFSLAAIPSAIRSATFTGGSAGDLAGFSLSPVGFINSGQPNLILIGAPGFNSAEGTAYLIPGRTGLTGSFSLSTAEAAPLDAVQFVLTTPSSPSGSPNFFGASVSSRFQDTSFTADGDSRADFIIGAPGYDITQDPAHVLAGGAQIVQSGYITVPIPAPAGIVTQIGVGTPFAPFTINATTPANLQIFVFSTTSTTPAFAPVTDINPATVVVNGVAFPGATIQQDPNMADWLNGIPTAIITISPRSALNLIAGTTTITITGQTLPSSPLANMTWTGSATVNVTGGTTPPVISAIAGIAPGPITDTLLNTHFGVEQYVPSLSQLSAYNYQPIPLSVALDQYLPPPGFRQRIYSYNHPGKHLPFGITNRGQPTHLGNVDEFQTLTNHVFDRGRFHPQRIYKWAHHVNKFGVLNLVVPVQTKHQRFVDNLLKGG